MWRCVPIICLWICSLGGYAQCSDSDPGSPVYKESFGGSFNSSNNGLALNTAQTPYIFRKTGAIEAGEYGIRKAIQNVSNWVDGRDHTGNNGFMMMIKPTHGLPVFFEKNISNACNTALQTVCFAAASLNRSGSGREISIHVDAKDTAANLVIASFDSPILKNNDSLVWGTYSFSYSIPSSTKNVKIIFSYFSTTPVPDDFAIDDIRVVNTGGSASLSTFFLNINNASQYTYPFYVCLNMPASFSILDLNGSQVSNKMFQWQRMLADYSYEDIPGATQSYFTIDSAKRDDSRFYQLRIADSGNINNYGCYAISYPIGLHVDPQPAILTNAPICEGQQLDLSVLEGTNVYWSGPNGFSSIGKKISLPAVTIAQMGKYIARVVFSPGCSHTIDTSINIAIKKNPISLSLPADTILCKGSTMVLDVFNQDASYAWSTGDTTPVIRVKEADLYKVIVYKNGCNKETSVAVHIVDKPFAFLKSDTSLCNGDTLILNGSQINASGFHWSTGDTTQSIKVTKSGRYSLQAKNICGTNTAVVNIGFERCYEDLLIPNAFTPNRDGLNDVFKPVNDISVRQYKMVIYNRWGQTIFTGTDMRKGWDGTLNRIEQQTGTYIWMIEYISKTGQHRSANGTVTLLR